MHSRVLAFFLFFSLAYFFLKNSGFVAPRCSFVCVQEYSIPDWAGRGSCVDLILLVSFLSHRNKVKFRISGHKLLDLM